MYTASSLVWARISSRKICSKGYVDPIKQNKLSAIVLPHHNFIDGVLERLRLLIGLYDFKIVCVWSQIRFRVKFVCVCSCVRVRVWWREGERGVSKGERQAVHAALLLLRRAALLFPIRRSALRNQSAVVYLLRDKPPHHTGSLFFLSLFLFFFSNPFISIIIT